MGINQFLYKPCVTKDYILNIIPVDEKKKSEII